MAEKARNYVAIARAYAGAVAAGEIPACKWTVTACQRQLQDLEEAKSGKSLAASTGRKHRGSNGWVSKHSDVHCWLDSQISSAQKRLQWDD